MSEEQFSADEIQEMSKQTPLSFSEIVSHMNHLKGKVLTIVDASIADDRQCKATKDLVRTAFKVTEDYIAEDVFENLPMKGKDYLEAVGIDWEKIAE